MEFSNNNRRSNPRAGLSFVEFVGCLVAMVGGVLLGSLYLGIDVQKMAVGVLEQAQVVAPGYFSQLVPAPAVKKTTDSAATTDAGAISSNEEPSSEAASDEATPVETAAVSDSEGKSAVTGLTAIKPEPAAEEKLNATRTYWDQLTAIMLSEAQGRVRGEGNPEEWELYDYLLKRKEGHEAALAELEKLELFGVDERLSDHGEQVIAWHKAGIKLFDHALSLLSDGPGAKLTGPFAQSWQSAATQLRMEENLVVERHQAVANYLNREYATKAPFVPAFQRR